MTPQEIKQISRQWDHPKGRKTYPENARLRASGGYYGDGGPASKPDRKALQDIQEAKQKGAK